MGIILKKKITKIRQKLTKLLTFLCLFWGYKFGHDFPIYPWHVKRDSKSVQFPVEKKLMLQTHKIGDAFLKIDNVFDFLTIRRQLWKFHTHPPSQHIYTIFSEFYCNSFWGCPGAVVGPCLCLIHWHQPIWICFHFRSHYHTFLSFKLHNLHPSYRQKVVGLYFTCIRSSSSKNTDTSSIHNN